MGRKGFSPIITLIVIVLIVIIGAISYISLKKTYYVLPPPNLVSPTPTSPTISSIFPLSGSTGTKITITGDGFTSNNDVAFTKSTEINKSSGNFTTGYINNISSQDGKTLIFELVESVGVCASSVTKNNGACPQIALMLSKDKYEVMVVNSNGESNKKTFEII